MLCFLNGFRTASVWLTYGFRTASVRLPYGARGAIYRKDNAYKGARPKHERLLGNIYTSQHGSIMRIVSKTSPSRKLSAEETIFRVERSGRTRPYIKCVPDLCERLSAERSWCAFLPVRSPHSHRTVTAQSPHSHRHSHRTVTPWKIKHFQRCAFFKNFLKLIL